MPDATSSTFVAAASRPSIHLEMKGSACLRIVSALPRNSVSTWKSYSRALSALSHPSVW